MLTLPHLASIQKKGFWTLDELRCLTRALGFHRSLFLPHLKEAQRENGGFPIKDLYWLIDTKQLNNELNNTFNNHDATYNVKVLKMALAMINSRIINFTELHLARMAFEFYEHFDQAGMQLDQYLLLRCLKLCGRCVSPSKLMWHLKRIDRLVSDRVMLYEFLEILPITSLISPEEEREEDNGIVISEEDRKLYKLCDFESILRTKDERLWKDLELEYQESIAAVASRRSGEIPPGDLDSKEWFIPPLMDRQIWRSQVYWSRFQRDVMTDQLGRTEKKLTDTMTTTPLRMCEATFTAEVREEKEPEGVLNVKKAEPSMEAEEKAPELPKQYGPNRIEPLISKKDITNMELKRIDLQWNIETHSERCKRYLVAKNAKYTKRFQMNQKQRDHNQSIATSRQTNTTGYPSKSTGE